MIRNVAQRPLLTVRPVAAADIPALKALAGSASPAVHTLPRTSEAIQHAVDRSLASFASRPDLPTDEHYLFVLESADGDLVGSAAISATAGSNGTFFAFRNDMFHQVSHDLGVSNHVRAITLCSDLTGHSQLSGFFVRADCWSGEEASLLSRARLLFAASAPHRFNDRFFAALPGVIDADGASPFWEAIGRKFFQNDFLAVERLIEGVRNRTLIVELMPHYPLYVPLLPLQAQAVIGKVHKEGRRPFDILESEGFHPDGYVDLFDGGPVMRACQGGLRSFSASMRRRIASRAIDAKPAGDGLYLLATMRDEKFRAALARCADPALSDDVAVDDDIKRALDVTSGDNVLMVKL